MEVTARDQVEVWAMLGTNFCEPQLEHADVALSDRDLDFLRHSMASLKTMTASIPPSTTAAPEMTDPAIATLPLVAIPSMHLRCPARPSAKPVAPKGSAMKKADENRPKKTPTIPRESAVGPRRFLGAPPAGLSDMSLTGASPTVWW